MSIKKLLSFDWFFLFQWMMATTLGYILGRFLLPNLSIVTIGLAIGIFQWLIIRDRFHRSHLWIIVTALGWAAASALLITLPLATTDFLAGAIIGIGIGSAQWIILRSRTYWAGWWIIINIVAWTTGFALIPGLLTTGVMAGLITGFALELLLRFPKQSLESV